MVDDHAHPERNDPMPVRNKAHEELIDQILLAVGSSPRIRLWKRPVGFDESRRIKYGIKGEADLQGIIAPHGRALAIECKTGSAVLNSDQKKWRAMFERFGGMYIEARSVDQVLTDLEMRL